MAREDIAAGKVKQIKGKANDIAAGCGACAAIKQVYNTG